MYLALWPRVLNEGEALWPPSFLPLALALWPGQACFLLHLGTCPWPRGPYYGSRACSSHLGILVLLFLLLILCLLCISRLCLDKDTECPGVEPRLQTMRKISL